MNLESPNWTRRLRQGASATLTVACVVTTLATSEPMVEVHESEFTMTSQVFDSTMILFQGESEGQVILSLPSSLLEDHNPTLRLFFEMEADRLSSAVFPATAWEASLGDQTEAAWTANTTQVQLDSADPDTEPEEEGVVRFAMTWQHLDFFQSDVPIATDGQGCSAEPCLPCDTALNRCEIPLTVRRQASLNPTVRLNIRAQMEKPGAPRGFNTTKPAPEFEPAERGSP